MERILEDALKHLVADVRAAAGSGASVVLYGSAARGEWVAGRSNVNVLLVLERADPAALTALEPAFLAFRDVSREPPLVIARDEWRRAADAFPIELADLRLFHQVLAGPDPLDGVPDDRAALRRAVEREWRGVLLRLRRAYVLFAHAPVALGTVQVETVRLLSLLARMVLVLAGRPVPATTREELTALAGVIGAPAGAFIAALDRTQALEPECSAEEFVQTLAAVEAAVRHVDSLPSGGPA